MKVEVLRCTQYCPLFPQTVAFLLIVSSPLHTCLLLVSHFISTSLTVSCRRSHPSKIPFEAMAAPAATTATTETTADVNTIIPTPPPWTCRATVYTIGYWTSAAAASDPAFSSMAYAPLEREAPYGSKEWGTPRGGISMIQLIRYSETPAGKYDELVIVPGSFDYPAPDADKTGAPKTASALRISRIYVSQRNTCWNGRKSE